MDSILLSDSNVENLQRMFKEVKNIPSWRLANDED